MPIREYPCALFGRLGPPHTTPRLLTFPRTLTFPCCALPPSSPRRLGPHSPLPPLPCAWSLDLLDTLPSTSPPHATRWPLGPPSPSHACSGPLITEGRVRLLLSAPCGHGVPGCSAPGARRGWREVRKGVEPLASITDTQRAVFVDMDEDGRGRDARCDGAAYG